jgi:tetratricopeptide (TPR) repeat protein
MISMTRSSRCFIACLTLWGSFVANERARGQSLPSLRQVKSLHALADQAVEAGKFANARERYENLIGFRMRHEGPKSYGVAAIKNNLGYMHYKEGNYEKASESFDDAVTMLKGINAKDHPAMAVSLSNLGFSKIGDGETEGTAMLFEEALKIRLRRLGLSHPEVADCHEGLGLCHSAANESKKAMEAFRKCLDIRIKAYGEMHVETAAAYMGLSMACLGNKNFADGGKYDAKATDILKKTGGVAPAPNRNPASRLKIPEARFFKVRSKLKRKP